jgi:glycolate oxidase iron-sulfur subunit
MQTSFTPEQLADPKLQEADKILRSCVHCGFCTATCPTYVLRGDELDSPRGRIYLIKDMLEGGKPASENVVKHIDRCLSCLSCMTTCPSGVHYMHLVDQARAHIEKTYHRPFADRMHRQMLATVLTRPWLFRLSLMGAAALRPARRFLSGRLRTMLDMAPASLPGPSPVDKPQVFPAEGTRVKRVALLSGCAQQVLDTSINEATIRLLTRHGVEVVIARGMGCCGALPHHMGREEEGKALALANIRAWTREIEGSGLDAIVVNASGCGTTVKDYGHMFHEDAAWAEKAAKVASLACDVTELLDRLKLGAPVRPTGQRIAYHAACSLQHGQRVRLQPKALLAAAGFSVKDVPEGHICCGSAGTYNILQPEIAGQLRDRKVRNIEKTAPLAVATGNIGCMTQIASGTGIPVVHTVELLDWATGGPLPAKLRGKPGFDEAASPAAPAAAE